MQSCRSAGSAGSAAGHSGAPVGWIDTTPTLLRLTLADASQRLRKAPGRPRNINAAGMRHHTATSGTPPAQPPRTQDAAPTGHVPVTSRPRTRANSGLAAGAQDRESCVPRLLGVDQAAAYLGLSSWTIRDMVSAGTLHPVRLQLGTGREIRRLLLDRRDLDALVDRGRT